MFFFLLVMANKKLSVLRVSIESTSGLVQHHASGSCSPKKPCLKNSETCTVVQPLLHNSDDSCSSSYNNGGQERLRRRKRDRERLRRQNETEEQHSIRLNKQRVLNRIYTPGTHDLPLTKHIIVMTV